MCRRFVDEMVLVDTDAICAAIKDVFEDTRVILEPAGALAVAGVKAWVERNGAQRPDARRDRLRRQHELRPAALRRRAGRARRAARGAARGDDPRAAGQLPQFCALLGKRNVTEFNYRYRRSNEAHVFVGVEVRAREETARIVRSLRRHGLRTLDLTDNEMAKLHVRHMVGGRASSSAPRTSCSTASSSRSARAR